MTARKNQTDDSVSLEEQFSRPLDDYFPKTVESASAAADVLSQLQTTLEMKQDDWSVRHAALQDAISKGRFIVLKTVTMASPGE
jgi:hypothetical protein